MAKVANLLPQLPSVTHVIYMESPLHKEKPRAPEGIHLLPFSQLELLGRSADTELRGERVVVAASRLARRPVDPFGLDAARAPLRQLVAAIWESCFDFLPFSGDTPGPEDTAIIMYTSGSTGKPKGVMITQANIIGTARGFQTMVPEVRKAPRLRCECDGSCKTWSLCSQLLAFEISYRRSGAP